ncbi:MAG: SDR family NAD(P)-dependent oxidoreductase [Novosphingobium sp.]|nr:SDR family NAD(P)-dependent oxidoreductase [Novosphingobium sp.]
MASDANAPFAGANGLIFGGAKGIGKAVALEWARRGCSVAVADIDQAAAIETAAAITAEGGKAIGLRADVLSAESIAEVAAGAETGLGQIDIVMNNVGVVLNGHPLDIPAEEWHRIFELNYFSIIRSNAVFLPKMLERGSGHIVCTASYAGLYPYAAGRLPYASSKAAIISLCENLAILTEPQGVRVSCLIPGPTATAIMDGMTNWTPDLPMYSPGDETLLILPEQLAATLADGMRDGRILIPAGEEAFDIFRRHAQDPDGFVRSKIAEFASGDYGTPHVPEELLKLMRPNP